MAAPVENAAENNVDWIENDLDMFEIRPQDPYRCTEQTKEEIRKCVPYWKQYRGQDYRHYVEIIEFINQLNSEFGKTIILITHDMHLAIENTDRAIVFADGEIIADDHVFRVLSDDDVITRASLKQTSLYTLACMLGVSPEEFISHFISYERMVKAGE